ncbi:hypothetical protein L3V83_09720 [Thiotrichales bacterium 19X7-9]|nr:hypothetical protein [Thiotrichales bacterium 19X7-9]TNF70136.1 MAG: hypothetical protein EP298_00910 [Gammaproteobacteria bacterium]UTW41822.1 hypothetical protein KFE69_09955 [bacterium SCSIO 12844]
MGRKSVLDSLSDYQLTALNKLKNEIIETFGVLNQLFTMLLSYKKTASIIEINHAVTIDQIFGLYTAYHYTDDLLPGETTTLAGSINIKDEQSLEVVNQINQTKQQIKQLVSEIYQLIEKNALPVPLKNEIQNEVYQRYVQAKTIEARINWKMVYRQIPLPENLSLPVREVLIVKHDMVTSRKIDKVELKGILTSRLKYPQEADSLTYTTHDLKVLDALAEHKKLVMRYNFSTYRAYIYQGKTYRLTPMTMPLVTAQAQSYPVTIKEASDKRSKVRTDKIPYQDPILQSLPVYVQ